MFSLAIFWLILAILRPRLLLRLSVLRSRLSIRSFIRRILIFAAVRLRLLVAAAAPLFILRRMILLSIASLLRSRVLVIILSRTRIRQECFV